MKWPYLNPLLPFLISILLFIFMPFALSDDDIKTVFVLYSQDPRDGDVNVIRPAGKPFRGIAYIQPTIQQLAEATIETKGQQVQMTFLVDGQTQSFVLPKFAVARSIDNLDYVDLADRPNREGIAKWLEKLKANDLLEYRDQFINEQTCNAFNRATNLPLCTLDGDSELFSCHNNKRFIHQPQEYLSAVTEVTGLSLEELRCQNLDFLDYIEKIKFIAESRFLEALRSPRDASVGNIQSQFLNNYEFLKMFYEDHLAAQQVAPDERDVVSTHLNGLLIPQSFSLYDLQISYGGSLQNSYSRCKSPEEMKKALTTAFLAYQLASTRSKLTSSSSMTSAGQCYLDVKITHPIGELNAKTENIETFEKCLASFITGDSIDHCVAQETQSSR